MRFAAGITLYNYTTEQIERIRNYSKVFDAVFLFDNSDKDYQKPTIDIDKNVCILSEGQNMGLPYAFNQIIKKCDGFDFLCTLDQDSIFLSDDINHTKEWIESCNLINNLGIVAPFVDYGHEDYLETEKVDRRKWVITSGSFVNLNILRKEGVCYDEAYFIDKFEIDLCEHLRTLGYIVLMYHGSTLHQSLGEESGHKHPNHSALRHYYLFRNRLYFNNKWHSGLYKYFLNTAQSFRHIFLIVLYEDTPFKKVREFFPACKDYLHNKLGKRDENRNL